VRKRNVQKCAMGMDRATLKSGNASAPMDGEEKVASCVLVQTTALEMGSATQEQASANARTVGTVQHVKPRCARAKGYAMAKGSVW